MSRSTICSRVLCFAALVGAAATALAQGTPTPTRTVTPSPMISATKTPTAVSSTPTRTPTSLITVSVTPLTTVTPTAGPSAPTTTAQCMKEGWRNFTNPTFKNQGDCVSFVASQGRARGNPELTRTQTPVP